MRGSVNRRICVLIIAFAIVITGAFAAGIVKAERIFSLVYVVQEGDNLTTIAKKFETTVTLLKKANKLTDSSMLLPGDELYIPFEDEDFTEGVEWPSTELFSDATPEMKIMDWHEYPVRLKNDPVTVNIPKSQQLIYHIKRGDSLYELAREFNTSVSILTALNKLDNTTIRIGQRIILPTAGLTPKQVLAKTISAQELNLLARVVNGEARGEPYLGKVAVAAVILNRVLSSYYPNSIESVIYQSGQFESVSNGQFNLHPASSSYQAAREALNGFDPSLGALYFLNPKVARNVWWFEKRQKTVTIGEHVFAR